MEDYLDTVSGELGKFSKSSIPLLRRMNLMRPLAQRMFIDQACSKVQLPKESIDNAVGQFCQQNGIEDEESLNLHIASQGLTVEDFIHHLSISAKVQLVSLEHFGPKAESHFLQKKEQLDQVTYSLLRVENSGLAHELYLRIEAGEDSFAEMAAKHSQGPEKASNGIIGPASLARAHPRLSQRLRTAPLGMVLEPFRIEDWWVVTRVEERELATFDEAMRQRMAMELFDTWVDQQINDLFRRLSSQSTATGASA